MTDTMTIQQVVDALAAERWRCDSESCPCRGTGTVARHPWLWERCLGVLDYEHKQCCGGTREVVRGAGTIHLEEIWAHYNLLITHHYRILSRDGSKRSDYWDVQANPFASTRTVSTIDYEHPGSPRALVEAALRALLAADEASSRG